jgi:site-specific DNA-cytosine methylase
VFSHIARLAEECRPPILVLENVEGLLTNKAGNTFGMILAELTRLGYEVDWLVMDLRWFGVPQSRPRLFVVAAQQGVLAPGDLEEASGTLLGSGRTTSVFRGFLDERGLSWALRSHGEVSDVVERTLPAIGRSRYSGPSFFGALGHASRGEYVSFNLTAPLVIPRAGSLAEIVAPKFALPEKIGSVRYYARGRGTHVHVRADPISHCVGTSLGGAPLFAVPISCVGNERDRKAFLMYSNWHREQDGFLVMRLRPERTALLFGPHTDAIAEALEKWESGTTRKFKLVGNMVAPVCAEQVAKIIDDHRSVKSMDGAPATTTRSQ